MCAESARVRNATLHHALRSFTDDVALQLSAETASGAEVPFELVASPGARTPLYCYRARADVFIDERLGMLAALPSYAPATRALANQRALDAYLELRGDPVPPGGREQRADAGLVAFLARVFEEEAGFVLDEQRFARAYEELEAVLYAGRTLSCVVVLVHGLEIVSPEIDLGEGLSLVLGDALVDAPEELLRSVRQAGDRPPLLAMLRIERAPDEPLPVAEARLRFRRLLTALRLFEQGSFALEPAAWLRTEAGLWHMVALGGSGRSHGEPTVIGIAQEDELRAFCSLIGRRAARRGEIAWALARFEMGCERSSPLEGLTDHLLALRALLEPEGPASGRLAHRVAAICALPARRAALAVQLLAAAELERALAAGEAPADRDTRVLAAIVAHHCRALLRDLLCGHLDSNLCELADTLLLEGEPLAEEDELGVPPASFAPSPAAGSAPPAVSRASADTQEFDALELGHLS